MIPFLLMIIGMPVITAALLSALYYLELKLELKNVVDVNED